jgi:hypothetical protein
MRLSGQLHVPAALLPGKEPLVHIGQEAGAGVDAEEKESCPVGNGTRAVQPVAIPTPQLYRGLRIDLIGTTRRFEVLSLQLFLIRLFP